MAERSAQQEMVTVRANYPDGSAVEYDIEYNRLLDSRVTETLTNAATTTRLYRADGTEQRTI